jgi:hypothetical protein
MNYFETIRNYNVEDSLLSKSNDNAYLQSIWLSLNSLRCNNTEIKSFWDFSDLDSSKDVPAIKSADEKNQKERDAFKKQFMASIKASIFDYGYSSEAEKYFLSILDSFGERSLLWLNEVFTENFDKIGIVEGVLRVIANIPIRKIGAIGITMATAAVSHKSDIIKENAIRAFENWDETQCLPVLENIECSNSYLNDYLTKVIRYIKEKQ